jgi:hypothetical protein
MNGAKPPALPSAKGTRQAAASGKTIQFVTTAANRANLNQKAAAKLFSAPPQNFLVANAVKKRWPQATAATCDTLAAAQR